MPDVERVGRRGKAEVDESVRLARVADLVDGDTFRPQAARDAALVA